MGKNPAFQFYPADWLRDPALRSVSLAARGLWADMLCIMWDCPERGVLAVGGSPISAKTLASMVGFRTDFVEKLTRELDLSGVFSRRESDGAIYSRRMYREELQRKKWREKKRRHSTSFPRDFPPISRLSSSSTSSSLTQDHVFYRSSSKGGNGSEARTTDDLRAEYVSKADEQQRATIDTLCRVVIARAEKSGIKIRSTTYFERAIAKMDLETPGSQDREDFMSMGRKGALA